MDQSPSEEAVASVSSVVQAVHASVSDAVRASVAEAVREVRASMAVPLSSQSEVPRVSVAVPPNPPAIARMATTKLSPEELVYELLPGFYERPPPPRRNREPAKMLLPQSTSTLRACLDVGGHMRVDARPLGRDEVVADRNDPRPTWTRKFFAPTSNSVPRRSLYESHSGGNYIREKVYHESYFLDLPPAKPVQLSIPVADDTEQLIRAGIRSSSNAECYMEAAGAAVEKVLKTAGLPPDAKSGLEQALMLIQAQDIAQRDSFSYQVRAMANLVLARRDSYLATTKLPSWCKLELRTQPFHGSDQLFQGNLHRMMEKARKWGWSPPWVYGSGQANECNRPRRKRRRRNRRRRKPQAPNGERPADGAAANEQDPAPGANDRRAPDDAYNSRDDYSDDYDSRDGSGYDDNYDSRGSYSDDYNSERGAASVYNGH